MSDPKPMDPKRLAMLVKEYESGRVACYDVGHYEDGPDFGDLLGELIDDRDHREAEATALRVELLAREQDIIAQDAEAKPLHYISPEGYQLLTEAEIRAGAEQAWAAGEREDFAPLAYGVNEAAWLAAIPIEPLARPSRIEGGTLHGPFPTDDPGRYEFYSVEDLDRVSVKNLEGEDLKGALKLLELGKTDVDRRLGQAEPEPVT